MNQLIVCRPHVCASGKRSVLPPRSDSKSAAQKLETLFTVRPLAAICVTSSERVTNSYAQHFANWYLRTVSKLLLSHFGMGGWVKGLYGLALGLTFGVMAGLPDAKSSDFVIVRTQSNDQQFWNEGGPESYNFETIGLSLEGSASSSASDWVVNYAQKIMASNPNVILNSIYLFDEHSPRGHHSIAALRLASLRGQLEAVGILPEAGHHQNSHAAVIIVENMGRIPQSFTYIETKGWGLGKTLPLAYSLGSLGAELALSMAAPAIRAILKSSSDAETFINGYSRLLSIQAQLSITRKSFSLKRSRKYFGVQLALEQMPAVLRWVATLARQDILNYPVFESGSIQNTSSVKIETQVVRPGAHFAVNTREILDIPNFNGHHGAPYYFSHLILGSEVLANQLHSNAKLRTSKAVQYASILTRFAPSKRRSSCKDLLNKLADGTLDQITERIL